MSENLRMKYSYKEAKDIHSNIINMFTVDTYGIENNMITLYLKSGATQKLHYTTSETAKEAYNDFQNCEKEWELKMQEYRKIFMDDDLDGWW